jgi:hypothetical protein
MMQHEPKLAASLANNLMIIAALPIKRSTQRRKTPDNSVSIVACGAGKQPPPPFAIRPGNRQST